MSSKYAYVQYVKPIHSGDVTASGKIIQLTHSALTGQVDLVSVSEFERLQKDFPDCVKGKVIENGNLLHMINYCYEKVKKDAQKLADDNSDISRRISYFESNFESDGVLVPDHNTESSIEDLANKYVLFQHEVRIAQSNMQKGGKHL